MNSDEADLFSTGIHVLEQHTSLLRAVEARIAQYNDFITLCGNALANIQSDLPQAQTLLTQLENDLAQARQDVAFTTALLNDEIQRVANVNAQRADTLKSVLVVAYARPRTLETDADVPSRQLVPGNVASPVPSCLQQTVAIPPELREIVALMREAPVTLAAFDPGAAQQAGAAEPAAGSRGRCAGARRRCSCSCRCASLLRRPNRVCMRRLITSIYSANQQAFRTFQTQRAAAQPAHDAHPELGRAGAGVAGRDCGGRPASLPTRCMRRW